VYSVLIVLNEEFISEDQRALGMEPAMRVRSVSDELVDAVMQDADVTQDAGISKLELKCAIAAWYAEVLPPGTVTTRLIRDGQCFRSIRDIARRSFPPLLSLP
jgi:hypothetical protein